jgi:Uma2 family endonuclease
MTASEFDAVEDYDNRWRYELIHGALVVLPPHEAGNRWVNDELGYLLRNYQKHEGQLGALDATIYGQYIQCGGDRRLADRVLWCGLGRHPHTDETPTVVAELMTEGKRYAQRDREEKKKDYRRAGVTEYWVFDRIACTLTVSYLKKKRSDKVYQKNDVFTTDLLPGFELPLKRIFELANRWPTK